MHISRLLALALPLLAMSAPTAAAAPDGDDCAVFKGADADLTTLTGAVRTVSDLASDNDSAENKRAAAETTGETFIKASDLVANVAASVSDSGYRTTAADYSAAIKDLGTLIRSVDGDPDEDTTRKAQELAKRVDSLSGDYDKAHTAACAG